MHFWRILAEREKGRFVTIAARLRRDAVLDAAAKG